MAATFPPSVEIPAEWISGHDLTRDEFCAAVWITLLEPGSTLDLDELSARWGFSKSARQRALPRLEKLGLIKYLRGFGAGVRGSRWVVSTESSFSGSSTERALIKNKTTSPASASPSASPAENPEKRLPVRREYVLTQDLLDGAEIVRANTAVQYPEAVAKTLGWCRDRAGLTVDEGVHRLVELHRAGRPVTLDELKRYLGELAATQGAPRNHAPVPPPAPAPVAAVPDLYDWEAEAAPLLAPDPVGEAVLDLLQSFPDDRPAVLAAEEIALQRGHVPEVKHVLEIRDALAGIREPEAQEVVSAAREACRTPGAVRGWNVAQEVRRARAEARIEAARQEALRPRSREERAWTGRPPNFAELRAQARAAVGTIFA